MATAHADRQPDKGGGAPKKSAAIYRSCKQPESKVEKREEEVQEFPAARSFGMPLRQVALARNRP